MNVLVSLTKRDLEGWMVVKSLGEVSDIVGRVDALVFHTCREDQTETCDMLLSILKSHPECSLYYVRNKKETNNAVKIVITGNGGKYVDDEYYLESGQDLLSLISNSEELMDVSGLSGVSVIEDFFRKYTSGELGQTGISPTYLALVKNSVKSLTDSYNSKNLELLDLAETASDLFQSAMSVVGESKRRMQQLEDSVSELESRKEEIASASMTAMKSAPSTFIFPTVSYMKNKKIIRIRDLDHSMFGTSFYLGFRNYMEKLAMTRAKLIFVEPVSELLKKRYAGYEWVTKETVKSMTGFKKEVFVNIPTKDVMEKLLGDNNFDIFIVVDRGNQFAKHVLNCKGDLFWAVGGLSHLKEYGVDKRKTFSFVSPVEGTMFSVPYFGNYPKDRINREDLYLNKCSQMYGMLYQAKKF